MSSHQNPSTYLFRDVFDCFCFWTVLDLCIFHSWFRRDNFKTGEILWLIMDLYFAGSFKLQNLRLMMDLFITNMHFFASQDICWWTGVVWITCGLLWCFYQLFGLSFWRHPFTAEDPLVSKWRNDKFLQICSHGETSPDFTDLGTNWYSRKVSSNYAYMGCYN